MHLIKVEETLFLCAQCLALRFSDTPKSLNTHFPLLSELLGHFSEIFLCFLYFYNHFINIFDQITTLHYITMSTKEGNPL